MTEEKKKLSAVEELAALNAADEEGLARITVDAAKSRGTFTLELADATVCKGETLKQLTFRQPTLAEIREPGMTDAQITAKLADVDEGAIGQLTDYDWKATQAVLEGFSLRRAAGGPARKL